uniref:Ig-like domain-containing protein n=1 Tax=Monodelphis domestica TaxID=13616 RepID=F6YPT2_MONDO
MGRDRKPLIGIHNGKKMEDYVRDSKTLWKESFFSHTKILRACAFVSVPKTSPTVFPMSLCDSRTGDSVALGCLAQGFFPEPVTLSWNYNGSEGTVRSYPAMLSGNTYLQTSVLDLPANQCPEAYKCRAEHYNTSVDANVPCPVPPRPCDCPSGVHVSLSGPSLESLLLGIGANLTCTLSGIKNSNGATFTWVHDTAQASTLRPIQGAPEQDSNGKYRVSSVLEICTEEWLRGDTFSCTVSHSEIETTTKTIYKPKGTWEWGRISGEQRNGGGSKWKELICLV